MHNPILDSYKLYPVPFFIKVLARLLSRSRVPRVPPRPRASPGITPRSGVLSVGLERTPLDEMRELFQEALVVTHGHLRFDLADGFEDDAHHDDEGRSAERQAIAPPAMMFASSGTTETIPRKIAPMKVTRDRILLM